MNFDLDWTAPIVPGSSMMGLHVSAPKDEVLKTLSSHATGAESDVIRFKNSPLLSIDSSEAGVVHLRVPEIGKINYSWQNVVATLVFKADVLASIIVLRLVGEESFAYRGLLFGAVGLGDPVADLLKFCDLEYDSAEELFFSTRGPRGFVVAGSSCDLSKDPTQIIAFVRVFSEAGGTTG